MKTYDEEQLRAINASGGHFLVLAPPGCGKTDILSERIVRARQQGVPLEQMLCLTFTNRASRGMRDRVRQRVGDEDARSVFVGNVHRYCSRFLFDNALVPENSSIIDDEDLADILSGFDSEFFHNRNGQINKAAVTLVDNIDAHISQRRLGHPHEAISLPDDFENYYKAALRADFDPQLAADPMMKELQYALMYRQYKDAHGLVSFADILILAYEHLRHDTAHRYRRYSWIQVDEVQDLNALQTAIIDQLLDSTGHYTVIYLGDEQQAIFSFLGAKLDQLQRLKERCGGHILTLGTNYRSPRYLLEIFNTYAQHELGVDPDLLPRWSRDGEPDKYDLILTANSDVAAQDRRVAGMVRYYLGFDRERIAILVPTNAAADRISRLLSNVGVTHFKISGTDMFRSRSFRTLAAFFNVATNDFCTMAWARLLHGTDAIRTGVGARRFVADLKRIMMTPSDLLAGKSYIEHFSDEYRSRTFVFFDTETTGLDVLNDEIVQIAAFKVRNGERVPGSDFVIFMHTDREIPAKLGDIDNPLVEAYANHRHLGRREGLRMFLDYVADCPLLGHNVTYDYQILRHNVQRTLHEEIDLEIFDSLRLVKLVEPDLRMYKLAFLIEALHLEGKNSHLADEDIAATKALVDFCYAKSCHIVAQQQAFASQAKVRNIAGKMKRLLPLFDKLRRRLYCTTSATGYTIADQLRDTYNDMVALKLIDPLDGKFDIFLRYAETEWCSHEEEQLLIDQLSQHITDMTASINEGDLINSEGLVHDRVFVMTVYKGKGLEFENVAILDAVDGRYPFFTVGRVLNSNRSTRQEIEKALVERKEDARKFYVALSRAKKRICVSFTYQNDFYHPCDLTPFMDSIERYFTKG